MIKLSTNNYHLSPDLVTLVNSKDEVIGNMDKMEAHRGEGQLHRASSVYLFRKQDNSVELLIQQRSEKKIVGAHQWANTICGNVRPTENYEECAYRRLREELGITKVTIKPIYKFEYHLQCNEEFSEWEMDQVFVGWYDREVSPNPDEVQDFRWVKWEELVNKALSSKLEILKFNTKEVQLTNQETEQLSKYVLTPWFVWMLSDQNLIKKFE